jgi:hypothetical protein
MIPRLGDFLKFAGRRVRPAIPDLLAIARNST